MSPAPFLLHQSIVGAIYRALHQYVSNHRLGWVFIAPTDVVLSDLNVLQPDILFVSNQKKAILTRENIRGAPDLAVEVLSPSTSGRDLQIKRKLYAQFGISEYWIVDPDRKNIEVLKWSEEGYTTHQLCTVGNTLTSTLLDGLELNLSEIFVEI